MNHHSQRGVALVITLLMLAIITIVAVVFLGLARRNRAGISLRGSQTDAEYAAEYGFQRAKAEVASQILATRNLLGFGLTVSRGFDRPPFGTNYLRDPAGTNSPFGPVLVDTNRAGTKGPPESRFYLDLNRNRQWEPSSNGVPGDPEWIFVLDNPRKPYGANNNFVARYAYIVIPSGTALDVNSIHNVSGTNSFMRNEGAAPSEINLAALFNEVDTNIWTYSYDPYGPQPASRGTAFLDASNFVHFRTNAPGVRPITLLDLFGLRASMLATNGVDDFGDDRPGDAFFMAERLNEPQDNILRPYPAAEPVQHYFTHQDLFDPVKTSVAFTNNLHNALRGTNGYKFYELLSELATDTGNESRGRINLNWANLGGRSVSSLIPWNDTNPTNRDLPIIFFTNAAQRILQSMARDFYPVTNVNAIMIYPTNYYVREVHRIMQQAANIYDAGRTNEFPSVFRPLFGTIAGAPSTNLYIVGWINDASTNTLPAWLASNTNGVPLVLGAKKGLPNFNEYTFRTDALVTRKLQLIRPDTNSFPSQTNQMYIMGLSNSFAVESWNSYSSNFPYRSLIRVENAVTITMTNQLGTQFASQTYFLNSETNILSWPGRITVPDRGFKLPLFTNLVILSNSVYVYKNNRFEQIGTNLFEDSSAFGNNRFYLPYWTLTISNHLVYTHTVGTNLIDFVSFSEVSTNDLATILDTAPSPITAVGKVWSTNRTFGALGPTEGIRAQISFSSVDGPSGDWTDYSGFVGDRTRAAKTFNDFLNKRGGQLQVETPFNPIARLTQITTWQANDPLIHYHVGDLVRFPDRTVTKSLKYKDTFPESDNPASLTNINKAYRPWGPNPRSAAAPEIYDSTIADPGLYSSDNWDFPTHMYPNIGWLGKVHRGTPWQSVYFKAGAAADTEWAKEDKYGSFLNHPTNDYRLVDIFTTALTDNAARGLLAINQSQLGAWSAALSGVVVLTNVLDDNAVNDPAVARTMSVQQRYSTNVIQPSGGITNGLRIIWDAVQRRRLALGGAFTNFADFLSIPELTVNSPFLNRSDEQRKNGIDDFAYERIPQQILGLLRLGESRFVIYAYGQALKPERVNSSSGVVENYAVTAEFATRTVMHVEGTAQRPKLVVESFNILPPD